VKFGPLNTQWVLKIQRALFDLIFPSQCKICGGVLGAAKWVCKGCLGNTRFISPPYCDCCGIPLSPLFLEVERPLCKECQSRPMYFREARAVALYKGVMRECIHLFKYEKKEALSKPLGELMIESMNDYWGGKSFDLIISVPLHPARKRERGFNQAELLARAIKEHLALPLDIHSLRRIKPTTSQTTLNRRERLQNVKGAFQAKDKSAFFKKKILLIDDLFTTGATIDECSRIMIEAGAQEVYALTLARTV